MSGCGEDEAFFALAFLLEGGFVELLGVLAPGLVASSQPRQGLLQGLGWARAQPLLVFLPVRERFAQILVGKAFFALIHALFLKRHALVIHPPLAPQALLDDAPLVVTNRLELIAKHGQPGLIGLLGFRIFHVRAHARTLPKNHHQKQPSLPSPT